MKKVEFDLVEECDPRNWTDAELGSYLLNVVKTTKNSENLHFGIHFGYERWTEGQGLPCDACNMNEVFPVCPTLPYCTAYARHVRDVMTEHSRKHGKDGMTVSLLASPHIVPDKDRETCHLVDGIVVETLWWLEGGL